MIHSWQRLVFGLREPPVPAWGRSCPLLIYGGPQHPKCCWGSGACEGLGRFEGRTCALGAVNSGHTVSFTSAAEGWEGSPLGSIPGVHGTLQLCFPNAIQMKAERGNPISLGIALKCRAAFPPNFVFWLPCCRVTHGVFLLINLFIFCLIIISNSKT